MKSSLALALLLGTAVAEVTDPANDINACEQQCTASSTCHTFRFRADETDEGAAGAGACKELTAAQFADQMKDMDKCVELDEHSALTNKEIEPMVCYKLAGCYNVPSRENSVAVAGGDGSFDTCFGEAA